MNKNHRKLKIGLDYHGVINENIPYFKEFCQILCRRGHLVHILTGGPKNAVVRYLEKEDIPYSCLFTIFDYYQAKGLVSCEGAGHFQIDEKLWNTAKADYCRQHKIDIQIDDSPIYGRYFTTPYCFYQNKNCTLSFNQKIFDFEKLTPEQTVEKLERALL